MLEKNSWGWYQEYQIESLKLAWGLQKSRHLAKGRDKKLRTQNCTKTV
jgi:hypothetical protein